MTVADWQSRHHAFGFLLGATGPGEEAFLVLLNGEAAPVAFTLPPPGWALLIDTAEDEVARDERPIEAPTSAVAPGCLQLLRRRPA